MRPGGAAVIHSFHRGASKKCLQLWFRAKIAGCAILSIIQTISLLALGLFLTTPAWTQQTDQPPDNSTKKDTKETKAAKFDTHNPQTESEIVKRLDNSASVLDEIMGTPDKGIPTKILGDAKCIIVIPSMINIAVGFGGRHGKGVATCRTTDSNANGWSA